MNVEIRAHAAALFVALLKAGELATARDFAEWALDNLDMDLEDEERYLIPHEEDDNA